MERIYNSSSKEEYEVFGSIVEDKINYFCETDDELYDIINGMDKIKYEKLINNITDAVYNSEVIWEVIEEHIMDELNMMVLEDD